MKLNDWTLTPESHFVKEGLTIQQKQLQHFEVINLKGSVVRVTNTLQEAISLVNNLLQEPFKSCEVLFETDPAGYKVVVDSKSAIPLAEISFDTFLKNTNSIFSFFYNDEFLGSTRLLELDPEYTLLFVSKITDPFLLHYCKKLDQWLQTD